VLFKNIWKSYFKAFKNIKYKFYNHFDRVTDEMIINNKCIVIIRHPYEIIMSGVRYHQITNEEWCNIKNKEKYNGLSYKEMIKNLDDDDKIKFEMENCGYDTINAIYNDIKFRNFNNNVLFIKLEDLYNKKIPMICQKIYLHCNSNININRLKICFLKKLHENFHRTNKRNSFTFNKNFKIKHFSNFKKLFPSDTIEVFSYSNYEI